MVVVVIQMTGVEVDSTRTVHSYAVRTLDIVRIIIVSN